MQAFYVEDSNLPVASTSELGITRLSDAAPSDSLTEAATIHAVSKTFYSAVFASNLAVLSSNLVSTVVYREAVHATQLGESTSNNVYPKLTYTSNLATVSSDALYPLAKQALTRAETAQFTAEAAQSTADCIHHPGRHSAELIWLQTCMVMQISGLVVYRVDKCGC